MANPKPAWFSMRPGRLPMAKYSLDELRSAKAAHAFLTEEVKGPEGFGECLRSFRFLLFFGIACIAENKHPPLTRCWKDLEQLFMRDPAFEDGVLIQSWVLMDFPFGPKGETALDYFEEFLKGIDEAPKFQPFVDAARKSRLGLHQDVMRTKKVVQVPRAALRQGDRGISVHRGVWQGRDPPDPHARLQGSGLRLG